MRDPKDSRERLAAFITAPDNHRFAQVIVNRVWARLLGIGLVDPVDDWEKAKPSNPELLQWLEHEFVTHGYDVKHVTRLILNSRAYQAVVTDSLRDSDSGHGATGLRLRRLTAEQPLGKASHCVFVWLGGGEGHLNTWDPKTKGDPKEKKPGSYYDSIETVIPGTRVCEHLPRCAKILDRFNIIRTVNHDVIDEHAAATNRVHTGRPTSGTEIYPSIGSIVAQQRGPITEGVPAYVLMGYPNVTRGPGFLGPKYGYVHLTDTKSGPPALKRSVGIGDERQARREKLLNAVRDEFRGRSGGEGFAAEYDAAIVAAQKLAGPEFMRLFDLDREPADLRNDFGGEFGQRCLLARRLIEGGVRFIEVSHNLNFLNGTGWDVHNDGILNQHKLIAELDQALSALVLDLETKRLLDKTLIVVATEFGRPAQFDGGGGRGHHGKCFSIVLAGGGLKNGLTIGETDELGMKIVSRPVSVPDLHATIHCALGINPREEIYAGDRPVPITDDGEPIRELFA